MLDALFTIKGLPEAAPPDRFGGLLSEAGIIAMAMMRRALSRSAQTTKIGVDDE